MGFADWILDLLYPPRCAFCRRLLPDSQRGACRECLNKLPYVPPGAQNQSIKHLSSCVAPLYYQGKVKDSFHRYKFGGLTAYADIYADFMRKCIDENGISCDIITWVPVSRRRLKKRGYDQARLLAELIAHSAGLECKQLLKKIRDNPPQSKTGSPEKRRANTAGVYAVVKHESVSGKRVLIADDIVTTGSTLSEAARVLLNAGAAEVSAVCLARSMK